jgi:hypothetical protein
VPNPVSHFLSPNRLATGCIDCRRLVALLSMAVRTHRKQRLWRRTEAVNELQAQYKLTPLSSWGKPSAPVAPPVNPNPGFSMGAIVNGWAVTTLNGTRKVPPVQRQTENVRTRSRRGAASLSIFGFGT